MLVLNPKLAILDETDSGLDVDALKLVGEEIMKYYGEKKPGILLITSLIITSMLVSAGRGDPGCRTVN